jgi:uridine kinase
MSAPRNKCLLEIASVLASRTLTLLHPLRVAADGRTASGKTTLADEIERQISVLIDVQIIRTSIDGFHRPRAERYARGRYSPEGYCRDSRDLNAVRRQLLDPLGPTGDLYYRTASFDLERDVPIHQTPSLATRHSILIVDGTFLQRPERRGAWDVVLFVNVSEEIAAKRGVERDRDALGSVEAAKELYARRYCPAYAIYEAECNPRERADIVLENTDFSSPRIERSV